MVSVYTSQGYGHISPSIDFTHKKEWLYGCLLKYHVLLHNIGLIAWTPCLSVQPSMGPPVVSIPTYALPAN